jgi:hypothetical protein
MMNQAEASEFDRLLSAALSGNVTPAQHERLDELLRKNPALRARYVQTTGLHLDLLELGRNRPAARRLSSVRSVRWKRLSALAASVALVAAAGWGLVAPDRTPPMQQPPAPPSLAAAAPLPALVEEAANARIYGWGFAPSPGQALSYGEELILKQGALAVKFPSGARAVLESPCVFIPTGPDLLVLRSGRCSVHAPAGAEGFRVETPSAKIVDLGTRFAVDVEMGGETALQVVEGAASVSAHDTDAPALLLKKGEAAYVPHDAAPLPERPEERNVSFVDRLPDRVVSYEATTAADGLAEELLTVTVQRGGETFTYGREDLNLGRLASYACDKKSAALCTRLGAPEPLGEERLRLLEDWSLVTGVINPARVGTHPELDEHEGIGIVFDSPVVNGPGPDVVLFDLQLLVHAEAGDPVRIVPGDDRPGLRPVKITAFDLDLTCARSLELSDYQVFDTLEPVESSAALRAAPLQLRIPRCLRAKCLATGIDLSQLGYAPGEAATRLLLQCDAGDPSAIDPVMVAGLPALPTTAGPTSSLPTSSAAGE